jgi:hypothetical protein
VPCEYIYYEVQIEINRHKKDEGPEESVGRTHIFYPHMIISLKHVQKPLSSDYYTAPSILIFPLHIEGYLNFHV